MDVDVLVGVDNYWSIVTGHVVRAPDPRSPVAMHTLIGWVLSGVSVYPKEKTHSMVTVNLNTVTEVRFEESLKQFWEVQESPAPVDDVMVQFKADVEFNGNKYVVKLPFKQDDEILPDNYRLSVCRLNALCKRLEKDPETRQSYDNLFKEYERDCIIEKVPQGDYGTPGKVHNLPHRPIVRQDRQTTKVRPVFDASAKEANAPCLNDHLHTGPNLLSMIYDVLLRFTLHKVVVMSDIKQAFLNVEVHPDHVDFLRFLWRENGDSEVITTYRFLVVVFGQTPSPFLLLATIQYHCEKMVTEGRIDEEFVKKFLKSLYMDDNINGAETVGDAFEIYKKSKWLMGSAGFCFENGVRTAKN